MNPKPIKIPTQPFVNKKHLPCKTILKTIKNETWTVNKPKECPGSNQVAMPGTSNRTRTICSFAW
ncbi:hypothetical protein [Mariniphaga sp.]|uniref:hypothetical protein n=1 Tax=Mariniphaga sp. TaxID=1954475 RepID=UPI003561EC16